MVPPENTGWFPTRRPRSEAEGQPSWFESSRPDHPSKRPVAEVIPAGSRCLWVR